MSDEFDAPQSRTEAALQNLLGASNELEAPQSRVEAILQNMLGADNILEPAQSREEALLLQILDQGGGGGSATLINNKDISSNGVYSASSDNADGYKKVTVSVANTYAAGDEGKVVSSGALVSQTAHAQVTQNGTIDTTLNNSVEVAVPQITGVDTGTFTVATDTKCSTYDISTNLASAKAYAIWSEDMSAYQTPSNKGLVECHVNLMQYYDSADALKLGAYYYMQRNTNGSTYRGVNVVNSYNFSGTNYINYYLGDTYYIAGKTYKWIAWE